MAKPTIVRTWFAGLIAIAGGLLMVGVSIALMLTYGGTFTQATGSNAYDFVPTQDGFFWFTVAGIVFGGIVSAAGGIIQLAAWVGALINTNRLADKTWFVVVLFGGLIGFVFGPAGLVTMVVYLISGPDGYAVQQPTPAIGARPSTLAPTT